MLIIAATSPQQTIVGTAEAMYHAHTQLASSYPP